MKEEAPMKERRLKVALGEFARSSLEASFGSDLESGAQAAVRHYARRLRSRRPPPPFPAFLPGPDDPDSAAVELELCVAADVEATLVGEADRWQVPLERIVASAVLLYLADIDAAGAPSEVGPREDPALRRYGDSAEVSGQLTPGAAPVRGPGAGSVARLPSPPGADRSAAAPRRPSPPRRSGGSPAVGRRAARR